MVTETKRQQAVAALRNAQEQIERALYQLECGEEVLPALVGDYIRDVRGWCFHAAAHVGTHV